MPSSNQPTPAADDGVLTDEKPPCRALVPVVPFVSWTRVPDQLASRADFITQLIATAEHAPQTRSLRRATPAVAQAAYRAHQRPTHAAGIRTRQTI